jgi:hypothetical protein
LSELEQIRVARFDISNWVIHRTSTLERLKQILQCGYIQADVGGRIKWSGKYYGAYTPTIRGQHPAVAVCFTEQPLLGFTQSWRIARARYQPYGIALHKHNLFRYGGRPVIYGDETLYKRLSEEDQYLFVCYAPIPFSKPVDWTHEREWRTKITTESNRFDRWGKTPDDGVPLIFPAGYVDNEKELSLPRILVKSLQEAKELRKWITELPAYEGTNRFIKELYKGYDNHRNEKLR